MTGFREAQINEDERGRTTSVKPRCVQACVILRLSHYQCAHTVSLTTRICCVLSIFTSFKLFNNSSPIVTGTSVLALKYKDGIMMMADTLGECNCLLYEFFLSNSCATINLIPVCRLLSSLNIIHCDRFIRLTRYVQTFTAITAC